MLKTLQSYYAASPVGLLIVGRHRIRHIKEGFDFAGYRTALKQKWIMVVDPSSGIQKEVPGSEWHFKVRPTQASYRKMEHKAALKYQKAGGGLAGWKQVFLYVKRWIASFSLWKPNYLSKLYIWYQLQAASWH